MRSITTSPFAAAMLMQAAMVAAARSAGTATENIEALAATEERIAAHRRKSFAVPPAEAPKPTPKTQRVKVVDDAGIANINRSREERRRINARRFERAQRAEAGKSSAD